MYVYNDFFENLESFGSVMNVFHSFVGFWYPANKICISLVYIIGTNIETKEKNAGGAYTGLNLDIFIEEQVHL
jgi:hypothetical protein